MKIYKYFLKLIDPLFYSLEGLSAAIPSSYIHPTALNCAVAYTLNIDCEKQSYLISEANGGRNIPRYKNSKISEKFYFTTASPIDNTNYIFEQVKGDYEKYIVKTKQGEVLRISKLYFIAPETIFYGYCFFKDEIKIRPEIIRLGSFRGKAELSYEEVIYINNGSNAVVDHPVDPLVSKVSKGIMQTILPYSIIINAKCREYIIIREKTTGYLKKINLPLNEDIISDKEISYEGTVII